MHTHFLSSALGVHPTFCCSKFRMRPDFWSLKHRVSPYILWLNIQGAPWFLKYKYQGPSNLFSSLHSGLNLVLWCLTFRVHPTICSLTFWVHPSFWSLKGMHPIFCSLTFRMHSSFWSLKFRVHPEFRHYWKFNKRDFNPTLDECRAQASGMIVTSKQFWLPQSLKSISGLFDALYFNTSVLFLDCWTTLHIPNIFWVRGFPPVLSLIFPLFSFFPISLTSIHPSK